MKQYAIGFKGTALFGAVELQGDMAVIEFVETGLSKQKQ